MNNKLLTAAAVVLFIEGLLYFSVLCMVITYTRVWINRVRLPILLVVS